MLLLVEASGRPETDGRRVPVAYEHRLPYEREGTYYANLVLFGACGDSAGRGRSPFQVAAVLGRAGNERCVLVDRIDNFMLSVRLHFWESRHASLG